MTITPQRRLLPLSPVSDDLRHGSRSLKTCEYKCGFACDQPVPNTTDHEHVQDVLRGAVARRAVLGGAAVGAAALVVGGLSGAAAAAEPRLAQGAVSARRQSSHLGRAPFTPVKPNKRDALVPASGFRSQVLISWGDRVTSAAPAFDPANQTPSAAEKQFGYNNDYVGVVELNDSDALLVVNHEYTNPELMFPSTGYTDAQKIAVEIASHGLSVVRIKRGATPGSWLRASVSSKENRRIHHRTGFRLDGPAAGDDRLKTTLDPTGTLVRGTFNNCAGGLTPWGTVLSGEENFNQYFTTAGDIDPRYADSYKRYGIAKGGSNKWYTVEDRFDLAKEPHEPFRFGWIVEVDPKNPNSVPVKHTMLGRFKHEGANIVIAKSGHAVAYMGDDERGDYLYRFVSKEKFDKRPGTAAKKHNMGLLSAGTLYVAKLTGDGTTDGQYDGTGTWIPLTSDTESFVEGFSVADVLINTRLAADKVAPTKMDRPEDVEPNLVTGKVYAALTNNSNRGSASLPVDEANPVGSSQVRSAIGAPLTTASGNRNGYVLEWTPRGGDHTAADFDWLLFLVCGDPAAQETYFGGFDKSKVSPISCPDNVAFDSEGNLWISTDGNVLGSNDGIFRVPTEGPNRGRVQQFLTVPRGAEACGPFITDDGRTLFTAVQHPGESSGSTFSTPYSTWPHTDDFPRPSVAVTYREA